MLDVAQTESRASTNTTTTGSAWAMNPPNESSDSLYAVLGVPRKATRDDVEMAFLRFRYRDADELEGVNMTRVAYAHSVLSDQLKRSLYDKFGEETLQMLENRYALAAADWLGLHIAALIGTVASFCLTLLVFVFILVLAMRLDGRNNASWPVVMIPIWLYWAVLFLTVFGFALLRRKHRKPEPTEIKGSSLPQGGVTAATTPVAAEPATLPHLDPALGDDPLVIALRRFDGGFAVFILVAYFVATVLSAASAEDQIPGWTPFVAAAVAEVLFAFRSFVMVRPSLMKKEFARRGARVVRPVLLWTMVCCQFFRALQMLLLWILMALRQANVITWDYFIVFIPVYVTCVCSAVSSFALSKITSDNNPDNDHTVRNVSWNVLVGVGVVLTVVLSVLRVNGVINTSYLVCMIPLLIILAGILCACAFATYRAATLTIDPHTNDDDDEQFAGVTHHHHHHHRAKVAV